MSKATRLKCNRSSWISLLPYRQRRSVMRRVSAPQFSDGRSMLSMTKKSRRLLGGFEPILTVVGWRRKLSERPVLWPRSDSARSRASGHRWRIRVGNRRGRRFRSCRRRGGRGQAAAGGKRRRGWKASAAKTTVDPSAKKVSPAESPTPGRRPTSRQTRHIYVQGLIEGPWLPSGFCSHAGLVPNAFGVMCRRVL